MLSVLTSFLLVADVASDVSTRTDLKVWILGAVATVLLAAVVVLGGLVFKRVQARPEEVEAYARAADKALHTRMDGFGTQLDTHTKEARFGNDRVFNEIRVVSENVAVMRERVDAVVGRVVGVEEETHELHSEVSKNREALGALNVAVNRLWNDDFTPLPGPLPKIPPAQPKRTPTRPPPPRAAWGRMSAPGARPPGGPAAPLPPGDNDDEGSDKS